MPRKRKLPELLSNSTVGSRDTEVRIIGGHFRGRRLNYHGDPVVRPMKHRTREAIFNLISTECQGRHVVDLFAGTGALGLEALSRGALTATFIEKHVPSAKVVQENIRTLDVVDRSTLLMTSAFLWGKRDLGSDHASMPTDIPWLVFCSPPYVFFRDRANDMLDLVKRIQQNAPPGSILVVEAEEPFDFGALQNDDTGGDSAAWDVRTYLPAVVGIWRS